MAQGAEAPRGRAGLPPAAAHDERYRRLSPALIRGAYKVTVREGAKVRRSRHGGLDEALDAVEANARELADGANAGTVDTLLFRKFDPVQQVVGRVELAGPRRLRAGVDVRGDGSVESYTGRLRRQLIRQRADESPYAALRRTVSG